MAERCKTKQGIIVAGGRGKGDSLTKLDHFCGVIVDHLGNVYVTNSENNRIMCWPYYCWWK